MVVQHGKVPDWVKYQTNGKTAEENYREIIQKRQNTLRELELYKAIRKAQIDEEIEKEIEGEIVPKIEKALDDLLQDFR